MASGGGEGGDPARGLGDQRHGELAVVPARPRGMAEGFGLGIARAGAVGVLLTGFEKVLRASALWALGGRGWEFGDGWRHYILSITLVLPLPYVTVLSF
jgi:hypothetical protein